MEIPDRLISLIRPLTISRRHWRGSALGARDGPVPGWVTEFLRAVTNTSLSVNRSGVASFYIEGPLKQMIKFNSII